MQEQIIGPVTLPPDQRTIRMDLRLTHQDRRDRHLRIAGTMEYLDPTGQWRLLIAATYHGGTREQPLWEITHGETDNRLPRSRCVRMRIRPSRPVQFRRCRLTWSPQCNRRSVVEHHSIAANGSPTGATTTATTSISFGHTVPTGTDQVLVVGCGWRVPGASGVISTCTWATTQTLTLRRSDPSPIAATSAATALWYFVNPSAELADVVLTKTGDNAARWCAGAMQYTGVDQTTSVEADNGTSGTGTSSSVSVTTLTANAWLVDAGVHRANEGRATGETGQTERWETGGAASAATGSGSDRPTTSTGSYAMSWSWTTSAAYAQTVMALREAGAAPPAAFPTGTLALLGVGL